MIDKKRYVISTKKKDLDLDFILSELNQTYWGKTYTKPELRRAIRSSWCFGLYDCISNKQVGFSRVITDYMLVAYITDTIITKGLRGKGLGKYLVKAVCSDPKLKKVRKWVLVTKEAHALYHPEGFQALKFPNHYMEKSRT